MHIADAPPKLNNVIAQSESMKAKINKGNLKNMETRDIKKTFGPTFRRLYQKLEAKLEDLGEIKERSIKGNPFLLSNHNLTPSTQTQNGHTSHSSIPPEQSPSEARYENRPVIQQASEYQSGSYPSSQRYQGSSYTTKISIDNRHTRFQEKSQPSVPSQASSPTGPFNSRYPQLSTPHVKGLNQQTRVTPNANLESNPSPRPFNQLSSRRHSANLFVPSRTYYSGSSTMNQQGSTAHSLTPLFTKKSPPPRKGAAH